MICCYLNLAPESATTTTTIELRLNSGRHGGRALGTVARGGSGLAAAAALVIVVVVVASAWSAWFAWLPLLRLADAAT